MAVIARKANSDPADLTFEKFQGALRASGHYPMGAVFIDAEASFAQGALLRNIREGRPAVVVYPDGLERIVEPTSPIENHGGLIRRARELRHKIRTSRMLSF